MQRSDDRESSEASVEDIIDEDLLDDDLTSSRSSSRSTSPSSSSSSSRPTTGSSSEHPSESSPGMFSRLTSMLSSESNTEPTPNSNTQRSTNADTSSGSRIGIDGSYFSVKAFGVALLAVLGGGFLGGMIPLIGGTIGRPVGLFLGAFAVGLAFSRRRYVETGLAGASVGTASALLGIVTTGFLPIGFHFLQEYGMTVAVAGGLIGAVLALLGHYFGRDLRAGLTRDVP